MVDPKTFFKYGQMPCQRCGKMNDLGSSEALFDADRSYPCVHCGYLMIDHMLRQLDMMTLMAAKDREWGELLRAGNAKEVKRRLDVLVPVFNGRSRKDSPMRRLSDEQIKAGILHDDKDVRFVALHYFAECHSPNPTVMPVVIEALERFGRDKAFQFVHPISQLAQSDETIRWAVDELKTRSLQSSYIGAIESLLCHADPRLVRPFENEILAVKISPERREWLFRRLSLLSWDGDRLWQELEAICEQGKDKNYAGDMRWDEAEDIVEELGRQGSRHADRMMDYLEREIDEYENNPLTWMEPAVVKLAGELRHQPAIPLVVAKMHIDAEVTSEECQTSLVKIGGDDVVRAIRHDFPTAEWHFRLYANGALGHVHTDSAVQALIDLLPDEEDADLQVWMTESLVGHFCFEANEVARQRLVTDPDMIQVRDDLIASCRLMGQDFPELPQWRKEAEQEARQKPTHSGGRKSLPPIARNPAPLKLPAPVEKKVGRNDPCPCGSGKKYKRCCLNKASIF